MTRDGAGGDNQIHRLDLSSRSSTPLPTLGVFENKMALGTAMTASPNGRYILIAQPDGTLTLYDSSADTFTISRKETTPLLGAYAASNFDQFVVGNALLNSSLVPIKRFETETGKSSGFAFLDNQIGFRITAPTASAPGVLQRVDLAEWNWQFVPLGRARLLFSAARPPMRLPARSRRLRAATRSLP